MTQSRVVALICLLSASLGGVWAQAADSRPTAASKSSAASKSPPARAAVKSPLRASNAKPVSKPVPKPVATPALEPESVDERELVRMPSPARLAMRAEMRERTVALDEVMQLLASGKVEAAGEVALERLGVPVWGAHQKLSKQAQPEQYMPDAMRRMALEGYRAASDFATVARTGDRTTTIAMLPALTGSCAQCHKSYRVR